MWFLRNFSDFRLSACLLLVCISSCEENDSLKDQENRNPQKKWASPHKPRHNSKPNKATAFPAVGFNSAEFKEYLAASSDLEVVSICNDILANNTASPESGAANRLESALMELVRRQSAGAIEVMNTMPPGANSELIIRQVFRKCNFGSIDEILRFADGIDSPDISKIAIEGATSRLIERYKQDNSMFNVNLDQLARYKTMGLSDKSHVDLICLGVSTSSFNLESASKLLDLNDQEVMSRVVQNLPHETTGVLIGNILTKGSRVDAAALAIFARSFSSAKPEEAISWTTTLPQTSGVIALRSAFSAWMEADPLRASSYLGGMVNGRLKDEGIKVLVADCVKHGSLDEALSWASQITDPSLKAKFMENISLNRAGQSRK